METNLLRYVENVLGLNGTDKTRNMNRTPIAFFAYERPEHTARALESLNLNQGAAESELFIFCDGAKQADDSRGVEEVRRLVKSRKWCGKVHVIERDENLGLANSIIQGVTEIINHYGRVIVIEDDLVLSPHFLHYMNDALEIYKDTQKVMHVSGYMFPVKAGLPETFFLRFVSSWGWGTWKRAWEQFEPDIAVHMERLPDKGFKSGLDAGGHVRASVMIEEQSRKGIDSWAIRWYASVYYHGGLSLYPRRTMVTNIGHDGSGVHCGKTKKYDTTLSDKRVQVVRVPVVESEQAFERVVGFYRRLNRWSCPYIVYSYFMHCINRLLPSEMKGRMP